jgi:hypothetical protein
LKYHGHDLTGKHVDHRDGFKINNQKRNLRSCTVVQNNQNKKHVATERSPYKGVRRKRNGYQASININVDLGTYPTAEEARDAYNEKATEIYGEFVNNKVIAK